MEKLRKIILSFCLLLFSAVCLFAQNNERTNVWYFGRNAGIDFNTTPPTPLLDGALNIWEGCATICNVSGEIMIYTDGRKIWNKNHEVVPGAMNLGGDNSATQSGIIVPFPGSNELLYVFSVDKEGGNAGLRFAEVDMTLNGGLGGLISSNNVLLDQCSEKVTVVPHCNKQDFWLIAHGYGNNNFLVWEVTSSGISSSPDITSIGSIHAASDAGAIGYMKSSPDGSRLALGVYGGNFFELFDFNNETGEISNPIKFTDSQFDNPYGVEFSPDGKRLYMAGTQNSPILFQADINLPTAEEIKNSLTVVGQGETSYFGAIQNAPNGKIYIAKDDSDYLSVIHDPNKLGTECNFIEDDFYLGEQKSGIGLPNLIPGFLAQEPMIELSETINFCDGTANIQAITDIEGDSVVYQWYFNDILMLNQNSPQVQIDSSGVYEFKVMVYFDCQLTPDEYTRQIDISLPDGPPLITDINITQTSCGEDNGAISITTDGGSNIEYSINGLAFQSSSSFENLAAGNYTVVIQDINNCQDNQAITIEPSESPSAQPLETSPASCGQPNGSIIIETGNEDLEFSINGTDFQQEPIFSDLLAGRYTVFIKDENACIATDEVIIESSIGLEIKTIDIKSTACGESDGGFAIETEGGEGLVQVALNSTSFQSDLSFEGLSAGPYDIQLIDEAECLIDTSLVVTQEECPVYIPSAFSPNDDGLNDIFKIYPNQNLLGEFIVFKVFDKWGAMVYETQNFNPADAGWDGTHKGKELNPGTYTYLIQIETSGGQMQQYSGEVNLLK